MRTWIIEVESRKKKRRKPMTYYCSLYDMVEKIYIDTIINTTLPLNPKPINYFKEKKNRFFHTMDHQQKIMSYNVVKKNDIICHPRP
jgi:hypothetical protein